MKKIRFIRPWRGYSPGAIVDNVPGGQAGELIARGFAVEESQQQLELETTAAEPEVRTADATPRKRRRAQ